MLQRPCYSQVTGVEHDTAGNRTVAHSNAPKLKDTEFEKIGSVYVNEVVETAMEIRNVCKHLVEPSAIDKGGMPSCDFPEAIRE